MCYLNIFVCLNKFNSISQRNCLEVVQGEVFFVGTEEVLLKLLAKLLYRLETGTDDNLKNTPFYKIV